jgi:uncharacterized protein YcbK (DUF882 family)
LCRQLTAIGLSISLTGLSSLPGIDQAAVAAGETRTISMYFAHTKESVTVTFKRDGKFISSGLDQINRFLRDWRADKATRMDPELIDLLWELHQELGSKKPIHIISGFRSADTNAKLKRMGRGVAKRSMHIQGKAADVYFPDVPLKRLRENALLRESGGVGYYPRSGQYGFVHVDTGRVRHWPRMSEQQLAALFRNKKNHTAPRRESPLLVARAERSEVPVPRGNPARETPTTATADPVSVARADIPLPRAKPLYLAQNVVAIPVSAPSRRTDDLYLIEPKEPSGMALARIDSLVLPPPPPVSETSDPTTTRVPPAGRPATTEPPLDAPAVLPTLVSRLDEPERPTVSLAKPAAIIRASVTPSPDVLVQRKLLGQAAKADQQRSMFPLRLLRRSSEPQVASLSPDMMVGDSSELTASIGKSATPSGPMAVDRSGKGDLLGAAPAVKFAVIELSGNRHMIVNRTNKGDFLGNRRAAIDASAPRMAAAIFDTPEPGEQARNLVPQPRTRPAYTAQAVSSPKPDGLWASISSIRQLFQ